MMEPLHIHVPRHCRKHVEGCPDGCLVEKLDAWRSGGGPFKGVRRFVDSPSAAEAANWARQAEAEGRPVQYTGPGSRWV